MKKLLAPILAAIVGLLGPVEGSIRGALIGPELVKAAAIALGSSTVAGGIAAALTAIAGDAQSLTTNATIASLASFILVHLAAQVVQLYQGQGKSAADAPHTATAVFDHPQFGPYEVVSTPAGPTGPIFHSLEGFQGWQVSGRPKLLGTGDVARQFLPTIEKLPRR